VKSSTCRGPAPRPRRISKSTGTPLDSRAAGAEPLGSRLNVTFDGGQADVQVLGVQDDQ